MHLITNINARKIIGVSNGKSVLEPNLILYLSTIETVSPSDQNLILLFYC